MVTNKLVLIPVVAALIFVAFASFMRERLPDPLAVHFGFSGSADGFLGFWPAVTINALLILIPALIAFLFGKGLKDKGLTGIFLWLPIGLTGLFFAISTYLLLIQLDLEPTQTASLDANFFLLLFAPLGFLMLILLRKPELKIGGGEVRIRSLGLTLAKIPTQEISSVSVGKLRPADFGGWGLRVNFSGDVAFLPSAGEALVIERTLGNKILIRSDNAEALRAEIERNIE